MSESPEAIRADIEQTREGLGMDVDALADKMTPSKIVDRQVDKVRGAVGSVRERVMGAGDAASASANELADGAEGIAHRAKAKAQGAPLAVGVIAFGFGLLIAGLFPASHKEKDLAGAVHDKSQPLMDEATNVAKEVAADLKEPAMDAADAVKNRASEAVQNVSSEATHGADSVKDNAQQARETVSGR